MSTRLIRFSRFIVRGLATCLVSLPLTIFLLGGVCAGPIENVPPKGPDASPVGKVLSAAEDGTPGEAFHVEKIPPSRILFHAFYDPSVSSIRAIHPDGEIVDGERLGDGFQSHYAFVAYKVAKVAKSVRINCAATDYRKVYHLTTQVEEKELENTVSVLLMKLSSLFSPFDGPPRPAVWFRDNCLPLRDGYADSHDKNVECRVNGYGALAQVGNTRYFFSLCRWLVRLGDDDAGDGGGNELPVSGLEARPVAEDRLRSVAKGSPGPPSKGIRHMEGNSGGHRGHEVRSPYLAQR